MLGKNGRSGNELGELLGRSRCGAETLCDDDAFKLLRDIGDNSLSNSGSLASIGADTVKLPTVHKYTVAHTKNAECASFT